LRARHSSSATSEGVTEPNRAPVGPALTSNRLPEHLGDLLGVVGAPCLVSRALRLDAPQLRDAGCRGHLGEPPREQVVAGVAAGDVDDVSAETELLDVREQDDFHRRYWETYGRSAISRARVTAAATCSWCRRQAPVIRRERILPFSEM
jgi:hypothetical protein